MNKNKYYIGLYIPKYRGKKKYIYLAEDKKFYDKGGNVICKCVKNISQALNNKINKTYQMTFKENFWECECIVETNDFIFTTKNIATTERKAYEKCQAALMTLNWLKDSIEQ